MDKIQIKQKVDYYSNRKNVYLQKTTKLEDELCQTENLCKKISEIDKNFNEGHNINCSWFCGFTRKQANKSIHKYLNGMSDLLSGSEYEIAKNSIHNSLEVAIERKKSIANELDNAVYELNRARNNYKYWKYKLDHYIESN